MFVLHQINLKISKQKNAIFTLSIKGEAKRNNIRKNMI